MSRDIFLSIETIVLYGLDHIDHRSLSGTLRLALHEQLSLNPDFSGADHSLVRTELKLPASVDAGQLSQSLGERLSAIISNNGGAESGPRETEPGGRQHE